MITALVAPFVLATPSSAVTQITVKNPGGLTAAGPVNSDYGFPAWYQDSAGTRIEPCLDQDNNLCGFLPGDVPDPSRPISFPDNFPEEFFYQLAGSDLTLPGGGKATLTLGLEAAFANGVEPGEQVVFARTRVVVKGGPANTTLTFKHPFGELTIDTDGTGAGRIVQDISPAVGNFTAALKGNFGPFLRWDPAVAPAAPEGFVGDPGQAHAVTGGRGGYNKFSVTSPGGLAVENTQFTISGKIATNTGVTGDAARANQGYLDVFATSGGTSLQVDGISGSFATTPMTNDPGSPRHYARIAFTGAKPSKVTVRNLGDKPASTAVISLPDTTVTAAAYDGTALTVAADSDHFPVTVAGIGSLPDNRPISFPMLAPPATVTLTSSSGASVTSPVAITGGSATDPGLPPVPPAPDPGPVIDKTPDNSTVVPAPAPTASVATPAAAPAGATVTLDASASTGNGATFAWSQTSGTPVTLTNPQSARPTFTMPFATDTNATAPATTTPLSFKVVVTETAPADGSATRTAEATVTAPVKTDTVAIAAGTRHRLGTEFRIDGTSLIDGAPFSGAPATSVVVWDMSRAAAPVKLGVSPVDTLGNWTLRLKPGPSAQITQVLVQSTRGGSATATPTTR
ncbi:hypothetical protein FDO65_03045 [Nakamurella flava]|uniref:Htaa domain-containing protein n=1 Tax=Nakamurella flava TaxID=2576308 RepID=A0A4U6QJT1_9ACTN|nr:hypothetical protein [Nakamurella flava]TKV60684.1 hypothetical protein FDO65_03045 [Nakamurella flava]